MHFSYPVSPIRATKPAHLILLELIILIIFVEEYNLLSYSLCNFFTLLALPFSCVT